MPELRDGETAEVQGSAAKPYQLKNTGGVYSCSCPAWRNQSLPIEKRTCKHLRKYLGEEHEAARLGSAAMSGKAAGKKTSAKGKPAATAGASGDATTDSTVVPPQLLLAHKWETDMKIDGWWMSEKLDGVRAYWDGSRFLSRQGNELHAPEWFVQKLPTWPLDGELWHGRKEFQKAVSIVRRQDKSEHWKAIRYVVFDAPGDDGPFEERMARLEKYFQDAKPEYAELLKQEKCHDAEHLKRELARVEALGGEGLMMRSPGSRYEAGRSATLLKVKSFQDAEARVIGHTKGTGRHKGRLGALEVELPDGTVFNVGTGFSDQERESPPPIGSIITFRYQELSDGGVPRFPSYVGVRFDADPTPWKK